MLCWIGYLSGINQMNKYDLEFWEFLIESNPQANWQFAKFVSWNGMEGICRRHGEHIKDRPSFLRAGSIIYDSVSCSMLFVSLLEFMRCSFFQKHSDTNSI